MDFVFDHTVQSRVLKYLTSVDDPARVPPRLRVWNNNPASANRCVPKG